MAWKDYDRSDRLTECNGWEGGYYLKSLHIWSPCSKLTTVVRPTTQTHIFMFDIKELNQMGTLHEQIAVQKRRIDALENLLHNAKEVLTLEEAAKYTGFSCSTLYKLTSARKIPFYKPAGKVILFEKKELLEWIRSSRIDADATE